MAQTVFIDGGAGTTGLEIGDRLAGRSEFDLVVLMEPDSFGSGVEGSVHRYVAMTRATQELVILAAAEAVARVS